MSTIIKRNTKIPANHEETYTTQYDNQTSVMIKVFEGEGEKTKDNNLLGKFELAIPPAAKGVPEIVVNFEVDPNAILLVSALDKATGKSENINITTKKGRLSEQ